MSSSILPNMGLIVPGVGTEPGPTWASDLNSDLGILDVHNHASGQGVQITPSGLNINIDLTMQDNNLTNVKTVNFTALPSSLAGLSPNLGCIYVAGNELYYNDESGNVVAITKTGSVNAGAGSITGLPSGTASVSYSSVNMTYVFQSATNTPANVDGGSFIFRDITANSHGVTVGAPSALAADYNLQWPAALPVATTFLTLDSSGNMGDTIPVAGGITGANIAVATITGANIALNTVDRTNLVAVGQQESSSTGNIGYGVTPYTPINNLSVTLTTTGRPVIIIYQPDGILPGTNPAYMDVGIFGGSAGVIDFFIAIFRNGTNIASWQYDFTSATSVAPNKFGIPNNIYIDAVAAGTYTYTLQVACSNAANNITFNNYIIAAYEL